VAGRLERKEILKLFFMKYKAALMLSLLVTASLISFPNRCRPTCDGRKMMTAAAAASQQTLNEQAAFEKMAVESSPLLRMATAL
jgi:hypothetical protein